MKTSIYRVQGMHCASCAAVISDTLQQLPQVKEAVVNFATEQVTITSHDDSIDTVGAKYEKLVTIDKKFNY
jgi:cation transport ATPase